MNQNKCSVSDEMQGAGEERTELLFPELFCFTKLKAQNEERSEPYNGMVSEYRSGNAEISETRRARNTKAPQCTGLVFLADELWASYRRRWSSHN